MMRRAFVFIFLAVQIAVPCYQLMGPRPSRFGWQMYAGAKAPSTAAIIKVDGTEEARSVEKYFGFYRSDLDVTERLPSYLCSKNPAAKTIRLEFILADPLEYPCR